jgi:FtsP/CotA-like multicopper oxidase with cupredoxin domain
MAQQQRLPGQKKRVLQSDRDAAAERAKALREKAGRSSALRNGTASAGIPQPGLVPPPPQGGTPDLFGPVANWAYSPRLAKFVDGLPPLGCKDANGNPRVNNLGQCLPVGNPDITTYPGSDYYEISLVEYSKQMHRGLNPTRLRGYVQTNDPAAPCTPNVNCIPQYLGPVIVAKKDRPVRIKFTNALPTGVAGKLFVPVDKTIMGAGPGPNAWNGTQDAHALCTPGGTLAATLLPTPPNCFAENRATIHLHGGRTPWISDGTPHQWITPAGEITNYPKGQSVFDVPDMLPQGPGSQTFYFSNQQSARLMFYHDHASGITRLNVYVGEAAGYVITDDAEAAMFAAGGPLEGVETIPLVIQDKTFVDATTVLQTDPTWNWGSATPNPVTGARPPVTGDLWWPHAYVPAQNPYDPSGVNPTGRWAYGPWFWPPTDNIQYSPIRNPYCLNTAGLPAIATPPAPQQPQNVEPDCSGTPWEPPYMPATPNPSWGAEAFMDTPVVNGTAFPTVTVQPKAYRFRILNAAHDRFWNLQLYQADPTYSVGQPGYLKEVKMVTACAGCGAIAFPPDWPLDGREGGVPDPTYKGPDWIQIGTEGGFLPKVAIVPTRPVSWNSDPTTFNAGNVDGGSLILGPAERADVIVDFSAFAGKTLILYNDAPAAFPALDPRLDYYTGNPDFTETGGTTPTQPGFGPNTRTIMQINVAGTIVPFQSTAKMTALQAAVTNAFASAQDTIIVGQAAYNGVYPTNPTFPAAWPNWGISRIQDNFINFENAAGTLIQNFPMRPKAIHDEMGAAYDEYGRMSAKLGLEIPFTGAVNQTFILQNFVDPPTEIVAESQPGAAALGDGTQIWKITHNGVDTHPVHFHIFDVQLINRVGWDGAVRLPDENELGWKDTVRISPLEDTIVAVRPIAPKLPYGIPDSVRLLNPALPQNATFGFTNLNPTTGQAANPTVTNQPYNFGWEYVWHCHILSHEEADMMRPIVLGVARSIPVAPVLSRTGTSLPVNLTWTDATPVVNPSNPANLGNPANEIGFRVERATVTNGVPGPYAELLPRPLANATSFTDSTAVATAFYSYRVVAYNAAGAATSNILTVGSPPNAPTLPNPPTQPITLSATTVTLRWMDNATNEQGFTAERTGPTNRTWNVGARLNTGLQQTTDPGLTPGLYTYRVRAYNAAGQSVWLDLGSVTVP